MTLLFKSDIDSADDWRNAIHQFLPDIDLRVWPDTGPEADVEFALVWRPVPGDLSRYPNLKAIFSLGAGVDHILLDPDLPNGVPIVRMIDPDLSQRMKEYVLMHALRLHRKAPEYERLQSAQSWIELPHTHIQKTNVGILGIGVLGSGCAQALRQIGFPVMGWSRTEKQLEGVACFHGLDGLTDMLTKTDILVCLLPMTDATEGILNTDLFARMPRGASIINVGRGRHLMEEDLLSALDSGQLSHAVLDVTREEPLPPGNPLWRHPCITLTPHISSVTLPDTAARPLCENIVLARKGEPMMNVVDPAAGY